jgi:hypothetical protein
MEGMWASVQGTPSPTSQVRQYTFGVPHLSTGDLFAGAPCSRDERYLTQILIAISSLCLMNADPVRPPEKKGSCLHTGGPAA